MSAEGQQKEQRNEQGRKINRTSRAYPEKPEVRQYDAQENLYVELNFAVFKAPLDSNLVLLLPLILAQGRLGEDAKHSKAEGYTKKNPF